MNPVTHVCRFTKTLFLVLCISGNAAWSAAESPGQERVAIPGPLTAFLRMAGVSQQASREEILPLVARNVSTAGYRTGWDNSRSQTEFLLLLKGYLKEARELQAMAGPDGVIRIAKCSDATQLLNVLGYGLRQPCGAGVQLEIVDSKRAFLTVDSGFPLADLEEAIRRGTSFSHPFPATEIPLLFSPADWSSDKGDVIDFIIENPDWARLYWSMAQLAEVTRDQLRQSPGLQKLLTLAPALDFYGSQIYIRSGKVVLPGGPTAEPSWQKLVGASPNSPSEFVKRLLEKDGGWPAAYFDTLARIPRAQQAYFCDPKRLERFYQALRGKEVTPSPTQTFFRPAPDLLILASRLQIGPNGEPYIPGGLETWKEIMRHRRENKLERNFARRSRSWNSPEQLLEVLFALTRSSNANSAVRVFLALNEIDQHRKPDQRLSPQTVRLLAEKSPRLSSQYSLFSEWGDLDHESISGFIAVAEGIDAIGDGALRANAAGIFQAAVGIWQILARQNEISGTDLRESWKQLLGPFMKIKSSEQLFDAARDSLMYLCREVGGKPSLSQESIIALLAGPDQDNQAGQRVRKELSARIAAVLEAQRLVSLNSLLALGDGLNQMAQGKTVRVESLITRAAELQEFELPKPIFTGKERREWALGLYDNPHATEQAETDWSKILSPTTPPKELAKARGRLTPFLRDTLVGLNYAYYEPPAAQALHNNSLFVRSHDFSGQRKSADGGATWSTPRLSGRGWTSSGGAHMEGSLADLPYALAELEQDFIVPENVQALIWSDLVPSLLLSAVLPRWWQVTPHELHAVALYQRLGEDLIAAAADNAALRGKVLDLLSDRIFPRELDEIERALIAGDKVAAVKRLVPADTFYLAAEFRRQNPGETESLGTAGADLERMTREFPQETSPERIERDFGVSHPVLAHSYARELLNFKPFPSLLGYSSRLLAESWESSNLYWARLADEKGYDPVVLHELVPMLTRRMVEKIFGTHLDDWPAIQRALHDAGDEFRSGKVGFPPKTEESSLH
jgi:hypothetical protein